MSIFTPNQTSAHLLVKYAEDKYWKDDESKDAERYLLIFDIFIKARSYCIINKVFFYLALFSGFMVLAWPSLAIFAKDFGFEKEFLKSAIVQTSITGIAALTFAIYSHYKKRQMLAENLMRLAVFSELPLPELKDQVVQEMERLDVGVGFNKKIKKAI